MPGLVHNWEIWHNRSQKNPIWVQIKYNLTLLSTNKEHNKPRLREDIFAYLASIVACYRYIPASEITLLQVQDGKYESQRLCLPLPPDLLTVWLTHFARLFKVASLPEKQRTVFQSLLRTLLSVLTEVLILSHETSIQRTNIYCYTETIFSS